MQIQSDLHIYVWNYITYDCPAILITEGYIWITTFCSIVIYASRIYVVQGRFEIKLPSTLYYKTHQIPNFKSLLSRLAVFFVHSIEARYWIENEDVVGAAPTGNALTTSEWSTIFLPNRGFTVRVLLKVLKEKYLCQMFSNTSGIWDASRWHWCGGTCRMAVSSLTVAWPYVNTSYWILKWAADAFEPRMTKSSLAGIMACCCFVSKTSLPLVLIYHQ